MRSEAKGDSRPLLRAALAIMAVVLCGAAAAWAQAEAMAVEYYHLDAQGNVLAVTDENANLVEWHDYDVFGREVDGQVLGQPQPRRFTGKERDAETGWDYFGARYYGSNVGRFTTVDPYLDQRSALLNPQRWNRYAYGLNNPLRFVDPDGRQTAPAGQQIGTVDWIILKFNEVLGPCDAVPKHVWIDSGPTTVVTTVDKKTVGRALLVVGAAAVAADALKRGRESEARVLGDLGEKKNTGKVEGCEGCSIPDYQNAATVGEIKDTRRVTDSPQLRI